MSDESSRQEIAENFRIFHFMTIMFDKKEDNLQQSNDIDSPFMRVYHDMILSYFVMVHIYNSFFC